MVADDCLVQALGCFALGTLTALPGKHKDASSLGTRTCCRGREKPACCRVLHLLDSALLLAAGAWLLPGHDTLHVVTMSLPWWIHLLAALCCCLARAAGLSELMHQALQHYNISQPPHELCPGAAAATLVTTGFHGRLQLVLPEPCCEQQSGQASAQELDRTAATRSPGGRMLMLQELPANVFADPYELATWQEEHSGRLRPTAIKLFGPVDLESMQSAASPQLLGITVGALSVACSQALCSGPLTVSVPLHARYHPPAWPKPSSGWLGGPHATFTLPQPQVLAGQDGQWLCPSGIVGRTSELQPLQWQVPVGNLKHSTAVTGLTFAVLTCGAAVLVRQVLTYKLA